MTTMNETAVVKPGQTPKEWSILIGSGILAAIGIGCWMVQIVQGFDGLGIGQVVPWGLYIAAFFLFVGMASGMVVLATCTDFKMLPALKVKRNQLFIAAMACYIAGGFMILMDVGKPERILNMVFSPQFKSMFVWDFYFMVLAVILAAVCLLWGYNKIVSGFAALAAVAVVIIEGWILTVSSTGSLWHSPLIPVLFLVEGLIVAVSAVLMANGGTEEVSGSLARLLIFLLPLALGCNLLEVVAGSYIGGTETAETLQLLVSGSLAPLYWGQIVAGMVIPFLLLLILPGNPIALKGSALLAILGVLSAKLCLLVAGQALPFMGPEASYIPSLLEIGGLIGGTGIALFLFVLGKRIIPGSKKG